MMILKKYKINFIILFFFVLITNCSNNKNKYCINGNEKYFYTDPIEDLIVPHGIKLPKKNNEFSIPTKRSIGLIGKSLDIKPPLLPVSLLEDSIIENNHNIITLLLNNFDKKKIWLDILEVLKKNNISIFNKNDDLNFIETGWIEWENNSKILIISRHKIKVIFKDKNIFIEVINLCLNYNNLVVNDINKIHLYNILFFNKLTYGLYKLNNVFLKK